MRTDGAESASAEAATVQIHRELYHIESRNALAFILRMRQTRVRKVERAVELFGRHRRIRRIDNGIMIINSLQQTLGVHLVRFFFDVTEVVGLGFLVAQAFLMTVKNDVVGGYSSGNIVFLT